MQLSAISIDVKVMENNKYDAWVSTEGSGGAHYIGVTADEIGRNVSDLIECLAETMET